MKTADTIVALSTPQGSGALGIIRLSGADAIKIASQHTQASLAQAPANTLHFTRFKAGGEVLDEIVLSIFRAPRTYTGEDVVELSFHGSSYILGRALDALTSSGARLANPGEFTQRAYLNGKLDLSQAEAVADLIATESAAEHRLAMHQMRGGFSKEIAQLREELIHFASLIELELDFAEEDVEFANRDDLIVLIARINAYIMRLIDSFKVGNAIKHGVPVAIIGRPNAGKSTLLNTLLNEERAIVSEIAGTTRDAIEDIAVIEGIRFRFIDTAGIRETADSIEALGIKRSIQAMKSAAIVVYLFDCNENHEEHMHVLQDLRNQMEGSDAVVIAVGNKVDRKDIPEKTEGEAITYISAKTGEGMESLRSKLVSVLKDAPSMSGDTVVSNIRHLNALRSTHNALKQARYAIESGLTGDLVAADIREALHHLGSITGDISTDELLGNIFGKFCIGK